MFSFITSLLYQRCLTAFYSSRNLPVFVKQIGFKRLHIDAVAQHELSLMKVARHPKLVEFIGLCLEPEGTFIVEGMQI